MSCNQEYGMFDDVCSLQPPGTSFSSLNRLRQCGHVSDLTRRGGFGEISYPFEAKKELQKKEMGYMEFG